MEDFTKRMKRNDTEEEQAKRPMNVPEVENELIKGHFFVPLQFIPDLTNDMVDGLKKLTPLQGVARVKEERIDIPTPPKQPAIAHIQSISIPTTQEALKHHELLIRERASHMLDYYATPPSITVDFTFEGQRYKGIAYPVKEEQE